MKISRLPLLCSLPLLASILVFSFSLHCAEEAYAVVIIPTSSSSSVTSEKKRPDRSALPPGVKFLDKEYEYDLPISSFESLILGGAAEIYYEHTDGEPYMKVVSALASPFDYLEFYVRDKTMSLSSSNKSFIDSYVSSYGGSGVTPNDFITVFVGSSSLKNLVSRDYAGDFYSAPIPDTITFNMAVSGKGNYYFYSLDATSFNLASSGSDNIFCDRLHATSCNIALTGSGIVAFPDLSATSLNFNGPADGEFVVAGSAISSYFVVSKDCVVDASNVPSTSVWAHVQQGATLLCHPRTSLSGEVDEGGIILYAGDPVTVSGRGMMVPLKQ